MTLTYRDSPFTLGINKSAAVVALDITKVEKRNEATAEQHFATYDEATRYLEKHKLPWVPSVQMVDQKVKAFADRAMAAIELGTQRDVERLGGGKQAFLTALLKALLQKKAHEAAAYIAAPLMLGGGEPVLPGDVARSAEKSTRWKRCCSPNGARKARNSCSRRNIRSAWSRPFAPSSRNSGNCMSRTLS